MNLGAVLNNLVKKGPVTTFRIHRRRKNLEKYKLIKDQIIKGVVDGSFAEQKDLFIDYLNKLYDGRPIADVYEGELKKLFIKEVYPALYAKEAKKPIAHKIVFMERGSKFSPSLRYTYRYVKNNTDYKLKKHTLQVRKVENEDYYENVKEFIRDIADAKAIFVCTANDYMGYFKLRPETTYIQLWHGCGAFKKVGLSTIDKKFGKSAASFEEYPMNTNYSYVTIASPELSWIFEESMGISKESGIIVPTGISRTDVFFNQEFRENSYNKLYQLIPQARDKKIILYAPTFRGEVETCTSPDVLDVGKFAEKLDEEYILLFKHHQVVKNLPEIPEKYRDTFAFDMTRGTGMDINELMTVADVCISDYSSVVFEYSLFERPMIFFAYDLEDYIDERGLYYNFDEITPGPVFRTNEEIIDYILHIEERFDKQEVADFKEKFMCCCDGHSTERILELIK